MSRHIVLVSVLFFLGSTDMENIITLVFFMGLSLILHLAHLIANFRRSCCKGFAAICMFRLPIEQYHQRIGIKSFVCFAVLEGH